MSKFNSKKAFLFIFISVNLIFIFLQIYKHSVFVKLSYEQQRLEQEQENLAKKKIDLIEKLHTNQRHKPVKDFAQNKLKMQRIKLKQIKRLDFE